MIKPTENNILIKMDYQRKEETTEYGLILPSKIKEGDLCITGIVEDIGKMVLQKKLLKKGVKVICRRFAGDELLIDDVYYQMIGEEDIIGVYE
jgi:co-chaperonin GroES (HSP10)